MRLLHLHVRRVPGIDSPFSIGPLESDPVLILGPNGSGKSTTRRALRALLFEERDYVRGVELDAVFEDSKGKLHARLRSGKVLWERNGETTVAPELPAPARAACFAIGVRDLLDDSGQSEEDLARAVRKELAGGYDLEALQKGPFAIGALEAKRLHEQQRKESDELTRVAVELRALREDEDRLEQLIKERDAARESARECLDLERAKKWLAARNRERAARGALQAFPAGIAVCATGDQARSAALEKERQESLELLERCESKLATSGALLKGQAELGALLKFDEFERTRRDAELENLREAERQLQASTAKLANAEARLSAIEADFGASDEVAAPSVPNASELRELDQLFDAQERLQDEQSALEERVQLLLLRSDVHQRGDPEKGIVKLRGWLRSPVPEEAVVAKPVPLIGGLLVVGGLALALLVHPAGWIAVGFGAGAMALPFMISGHYRNLMQERERFANEYRQSGLDQPTKWSKTAVQHLLDDLEDEVRAMELAAAYRQDADQLRVRQSKLDNEAEALAQSERELFERLGFSALAGRIERRELIQRIAELRAARLVVAEASAQLQRDKRRCLELRQSFQNFLSQTGLEASASVEAIGASLRRLADMSAKHKEASQRAAEAQSELPLLKARFQRQEEQLKQFYAERQLKQGDKSGLELLLAERDDFMAAREALADCERELRQLEAELEGQADLIALSESEIEGLLAAARQRAERSSELDQHIAVVTHALDKERQLDRLGEQSARVAQAELELLVKREDLLERSASGFLLDDITREYERQSRPDVLQRASSLFADFTDDHYQLLIESENEATRVHFRARENDTNRLLGLGELSDGTRMQLLLSVRIAFAEQAERGEKLPIVLDEAFSLSDSNRFRAMVGAVYQLCHEGRQVIYMSANLGEHSLWTQLAQEFRQQPPTVIDMARARKLSLAVETPKSLSLAKGPAIPSCVGKTAEQYGFELGVGLPQPFQPVEALHLFHLLNDDLPLLEHLLKARVQTVGHWRAMRQRGSLAVLVGDAEKQARLEARVSIAEFGLAAWHQGRGKPITRQVLEEAEGVTTQRLEEFVELSNSVGEDAKLLLEALQQRKLKNYRRNLIDKFESWLLERGYLDKSERLSPEALQRDVIAQSQSLISSGQVSAVEVIELVDALTQLLERSLPKVHSPAST